MKAYSLDFRQQIIDVYNQEKISQRQLAKKFVVALSIIVKLLRRYRATGTVSMNRARSLVLNWSDRFKRHCCINQLEI